MWVFHELNDQSSQHGALGLYIEWADEEELAFQPATTINSPQDQSTTVVTHLLE